VTAWDSEPSQRLGRSRIAACVGKDVRAPELEATIRRVLAPRRRLRPPARRQGQRILRRLTGREMQVCTLLLAGRRAPQIGREMFIAAKTVHTFRYRIFGSSRAWRHRAREARASHG